MTPNSLSAAGRPFRPRRLNPRLIANVSRPGAPLRRNAQKGEASAPRPETERVAKLNALTALRVEAAARLPNHVQGNRPGGEKTPPKLKTPQAPPRRAAPFFSPIVPNDSHFPVLGRISQRFITGSWESREPPIMKQAAVPSGGDGLVSESPQGGRSLCPRGEAHERCGRIPRFEEPAQNDGKGPRRSRLGDQGDRRPFLGSLVISKKSVVHFCLIDGRFGNFRIDYSAQPSKSAKSHDLRDFRGETVELG